MSEMVKGWITELLSDEIAEIDCAISNEKMWAKADSMHETNIPDLEEYKEVLTEMLEKYGKE